MKGISSRSRPSLLAFAAAVIASSVVATELVAQGSAVSARDAWVREAPAGRKVTGVFVVIENPGAVARSIVSGSTNVADTLELHEMKREGDMMQMSPVKSILIPARGQVELKPGGLHLMLFGLRKPLVVGDTVKLTLTLDDGSHVALSAPVRKPGGMP
jgi:copper(I)-binding protein